MVRGALAAANTLTERQLAEDPDVERATRGVIDAVVALQDHRETRGGARALMAADLFVLVRVGDGLGWHLVAGPVAAADATDAATTALQQRTGARVIVARAIRSFTSVAVVTEDAAPVVTP
jgi:hypothetical protein